VVSRVAILTLTFLLVAGLERLPRLRFAPARFLRAHLATDTAWYLVATGASVVFTLGVGPVIAPLALADGLVTLPLALRVAVAVIGYDLVAFLVHRRLHRVDALWAVHKVHHSSRHLDWLATTRTHMFEHLVRNLPAQGLLLLAGFPVSVVTAATAIYAGFALFGHSNLRVNLRWAEPVFITPRVHRRHHVPATTERNFGTVLSLWDRACGTLVELDTAAAEPLGVPGELETYPQRFADAVRAPGRELRARRARELTPVTSEPEVPPRPTGDRPPPAPAPRRRRTPRP